MKEDNLAKSLKNIVCYDEVTQEMKDSLKAKGVELYNLEEVIAAGTGKDEPLERQMANDYPIFSYTSGTTGDSKGVKLTHANFIWSTGEIVNLFDLTE